RVRRCGPCRRNASLPATRALSHADARRELPAGADQVCEGAVDLPFDLLDAAPAILQFERDVAAIAMTVQPCTETREIDHAAPGRQFQFLLEVVGVGAGGVAQVDVPDARAD